MGREIAYAAFCIAAFGFGLISIEYESAAFFYLAAATGAMLLVYMVLFP